LETADWYGLYREGWGKEIVPEAYAHPAKFARALIRRIYDHLAERGYLKAGDVVADPFGGVALGALDAMRLGCTWLGVELEQKFVDLGQQNIELWESRYRPLWPDTWGTAILLQGDSRELGQVVGQVVGCVVSSPPYAETPVAGYDGSMGDKWRETGQTPRQRSGGKLPAEQYNTDNPGNLGNMKASDVGLAAVVSSPPYIGTAVEKNSSGIDKGKQWKTYLAQGGSMKLEAFIEQQERHSQGYGQSPGQLGAMREGSHAQAIVASPPFAEAQTGGGIAKDGTPGQRGCHETIAPAGYQNQGSTPGNLATLKATGEGHAATVQVVCSSPPYEHVAVGGNDVEATHRRLQKLAAEGKAGPRSVSYAKSEKYAASGNLARQEYGNSEGQLSNSDDFWTAARLIVNECHKLLAPGGVAVWVLKRFVRNKEIVEFPDQWRLMCEAAGFEAVEWIRAWLVEERGTQIDLFGEHHTKTVERKSFFRRLYEGKYPENSIDWEDVIVMRKVM